MTTALATKPVLEEGMTLTLKEDIWEGNGELHGLRIDTGTTGTVEWISSEQVHVKFTFDRYGRTYTDYVWIDKEQLEDYFEEFPES